MFIVSRFAAGGLTRRTFCSRESSQASAQGISCSALALQTLLLSLSQRPKVPCLVRPLCSHNPTSMHACFMDLHAGVSVHQKSHPQTSHPQSRRSRTRSCVHKHEQLSARKSPEHMQGPIGTPVSLRYLRPPHGDKTVLALRGQCLPIFPAPLLFFVSEVRSILCTCSCCPACSALPNRCFPLF
jgi:hypothetical protein